MKIKDVFNALNQLYDFNSQEEWDKSGINTNDFLNNKITKAFICLDINEELIIKAISEKVNLIISHHPLYIDENDIKKPWLKKINKLIKLNEISIISCHTNFDKNKHGMNYHLCKKIGLKNINRLDNNYYIFYGDFEKGKNISDICNLLKQKFDLEYIVVSHNIDLNKKINRIAICGGSGSNFIDDIKKKYKIDLYITSEIKWNYWNNKNNNKMLLCDVPHHIEKEFIVVIYNLLMTKFKNDIENFKKITINKIGIF